MKGRNTSCITIRLPDDIVKALGEYALQLGYPSPGLYIKAVILEGFTLIRDEFADTHFASGDFNIKQIIHSLEKDAKIITCSTPGKPKIETHNIITDAGKTYLTEPLDANHYIEHDKNLSKVHSIITTKPRDEVADYPPHNVITTAFEETILKDIENIDTKKLRVKRRA